MGSSWTLSVNGAAVSNQVDFENITNLPYSINFTTATNMNHYGYVQSTGGIFKCNVNQNTGALTGCANTTAAMGVSVAFSLFDLTNLYIFVSQPSASGGNLGGFAGADALCNSDPMASTLTVPPGTTWKALLSGNNSTISGRTYKNVNDQLLAVATGGNLVGPNDLLNPIDATATLDSVWTGGYFNETYNGSNCNGWTSSSNGDVGITGSPYEASVTIYGSWWGQPFANTCDAGWPIYCAQQPLP